MPSGDGAATPTLADPVFRRRADDYANHLHAVDVVQVPVRGLQPQSHSPGTDAGEFQLVLEDGRFYRWFVNSFIIATITTLSNVFFDSLVGYALCKFRFPGRYIVFIAILSTLMIPTEMLVVPWYLMSNAFGWLDTYWGIMFPGLMTAFDTFLMKQFFETVPDDFIEAARIDGLNEFQIW